VFKLHSRPAATRKVHLAFKGCTTTVSAHRSNQIAKQSTCLQYQVAAVHCSTMHRLCQLLCCSACKWCACHCGTWHSRCKVAADQLRQQLGVSRSRISRHAMPVPRS
jgi:hypothetical protein